MTTNGTRDARRGASRAGAAPARCGGFTIVELMISVALGLIILAALTSYFVQTSQNRSEIERNSRQIENGRYAVDTLRTDISLAGFYADMWQPQAVTTYSTPAPCETTAAAMGFVPSLLAPQLPVPIFGFADGLGVPGCAVGAVAGNDVLVLRRFNSERIPAATPVGTQVYAQVSSCPADPPNRPFVVSEGSSGAFVLRKLDCATRSDLWRYHEHVYYLRNCSDCAGAGDGIPTLWRLELDQGAMRALPYVEGIEAFRVEYGVDNLGDGTVDAWRRCDAAAPCAAADWANVVAARIFVLARNLERSPAHNDVITYSMGQAGTLGPFNDGFKRFVYTAQVALQNRAGLREPKL